MEKIISIAPRPHRVLNVWTMPVLLNLNLFKIKNIAFVSLILGTVIYIIVLCNSKKIKSDECFYSSSAFSAFIFSIDKHEMEVIEADGEYTKRNKIHRLPINVAQRYSVIVTANQPVDNYIMRSEFQKKCMPDAVASLPT